MQSPDRPAEAGGELPGSGGAPAGEWDRLEPDDAAKIRILIVEDDGIIALSTSEILERAGFSVLPPVASGEEALKHLERPPRPDLFLMDIKLAGKMDGIETARQIMELSGIPVIFMSAWSDNPRIVRAALAKPYGYLVKPVNDRELLATIATTLYRHSVDRKLAESEGRYRAVVDHAAEGILLLTYGTHETVEANPAFRQLIGYGNGDTLPDIGDLLVCPESDDVTAHKQVLFHGGHIRDIRLRHRDGSCRDVDISSSIITRRGEPAFLSILTHDVTDRKRAEAALSAANRKLNLLSEVTRHDILNQLTKLRGWIEISKDYLGEDEKVAGFLEKEIQSADAITRLISFTRDYQNMGVTAPVWQEISATVRDVFPEASRGGVTVAVDVIGLEIYADPLFPKVIYNLLDNAIRHGGDAVSSFRFTARETDTGLVLIAEDNGTGIPAEEKEKIFKRGFGKNTGLGLFLSREILGITGSTITETGEPGRGARFEIAVPKGMYRYSLQEEKSPSGGNTAS